ncbi:hypothetical protein AA0113_g10468 [Alternaria arborescens]|uniref:Uncharacterized protein n=1 Tax=Alternaria arborescens TaxID=156630 RepID=A0A4V1X0E8_9PLEO|nr:hypothetical protein AA0111_g12012 [Alternaria arborescens]RYO14280.1 hypothetical protein AA0111_g12012 [Alternaria arborescens]RYO45238.1 hypothetical protein AA0113_g10468 [Alternaria arborescens]
MRSLSRNTLDHVFVRSKRTGDVKIRGSKGSSHRSASSLAPHERILHYVGKGRTYVCRCTSPRRHSVRTSCVAFESRHLSADLTLYLERHNLQSCAIADLEDYHEWQDAKWEMEGVYADEFHYANRDKDVVCRCLQSRSHDYGTPRHPEIIERCAEFFCAYSGELTATKKQWKSFDYSSPPPYLSIVQDQPDHQRTFKDTKKKHRPTISPEVEVRNKAECKASVLPDHHGHASIQEATPESEPEMLPLAWQPAHPSFLKARPGAESPYSTPMGTIPPSRSASPSVALNLTQRASSSASSSQFQDEAGTAVNTHVFNPLRTRDWLTVLALTTCCVCSVYEEKAVHALLKRFPDLEISDYPEVQVTGVVPGSYGDNADLPNPESGSMKSVPVHGDALGIHEENGCPEEDGGYEENGHGTTTSRESLPFDNGLWYRDRLHYEKYGDMASQISVAELPARSLPVELPCFDPNEGNQTPVAGLTDRRSPVKLPATPVRRRHTAMLKKLEGREWDTASELEAKHSRFRHEQTISGTFTCARKTARLSSPFE